MRLLTFVTACTLVAAPPLVAQQAETGTTSPVKLVAARVTLDGTSNLHEYSASTTTVRLTDVRVASDSEGGPIEDLLQPGNLKTFDVAVAAVTLKSPKDGIDDNMHKALKAKEHPDLQFRLRTLDGSGPDYRATGVLSIAGVEKDVTIALKTERRDASVVVTGGMDLLMTDYGIKPPTAMLGMLRTSPKVHIQLELTLGE